MIGKFFAVLAMVTIVAIPSLRAQSSVLTDLDNACIGIAAKNLEIQVILTGVKPTTIDPAVPGALTAAKADMASLVGTAETALGNSGVPALAAMQGRLSAANLNMAGSTNTLLGYIAAGNILGACATVPSVAAGGDALVLIATDIRAEIQKTKGKN